MGPRKAFGVAELSIFLLALAGGTICSLTSKVMLTMKGIGMTGEEEPFSFPLFQTFGMFLGMLAALVMHFLVIRFRIPFPGYPGYYPAKDDVAKEGPEPEPEPIPMWKLAVLIIPSVFDLTASALAMFGLRHVDVSIYQMLRGSAIVFVALLKQFMLRHPLERFKWIGIAYNVLSIILVGLTAMLSNTSAEEGRGIDTRYNSPMTGVVLILCGAFVQSLQYAFEEKVMNDADTAIPPLLLIGMEGLWGTLLCVLVLYPAAYYIPGQDHGSLENAYNTYVMFTQSAHIQGVFLLYFLSVLQYNILAVLVTFMLDSVWHAILDNFRPITIWGFGLMIHSFGSQYGEVWTSASWLQLAGLIVLLFGTAVYNGSIIVFDDEVAPRPPGYTHVSPTEIEMGSNGDGGGHKQRKESFTDKMIKNDLSMASPALSRSPLIHQQLLLKAEGRVVDSPQQSAQHIIHSKPRSYSSMESTTNAV